MKKNTFLLIVIFTMLGVQLSAQNTWVRKADLTGDSRYCGAGFSIGTKGYFSCGLTSSGWDNDLWEYSQTTNTWSQKADVPGITGRYGPAGFAIGNKGYIGLGCNSSNTPQTDLYEYNPVANSWTSKAGFPGSARYNVATFVIDSSAYLCCGTIGTSPYLSSVWAYNKVTNAWSQKSDVPGDARLGGIAFAINGTGYFGTGYSSASNLLQDFYAYNPLTDTWTSRQDFPIPTQASCAFSIGSWGYVGTGQSDLGGSNHSNFYDYSPATNSWTTEASYSGPLVRNAIGFCLDSYGYIGSGYIPGGTYSKEFWEYRPKAEAVEQHEKAAEMIFPNPSNGPVNIISKNNKLKTIHVFDQSGRMVFEATRTNQHSQIDLSILSQGKYVISVESIECVVLTQVIIINK
ncbi:MAG: T9SS type A sorting domain-containing protein [Bacteroidota bacterium]